MGDAHDIASCLNGSPEVFRSLVERHAADVRAFIAARAGPRAADEVTIESFTRAWVRLRSLRDRTSFGSWVKGIALRVLREHARERGRVAPAPSVNRSPWPRSDPELNAAVDALPEPYRSAVRLRFYEGLTCEQIAAREGAPVGTATKRLSRAYALLRDALSPEREPLKREAHR